MSDVDSKIASIFKGSGWNTEVWEWREFFTEIQQLVANHRSPFVGRKNEKGEVIRMRPRITWSLAKLLELIESRYVYLKARAEESLTVCCQKNGQMSFSSLDGSWIALILREYRENLKDDSEARVATAKEIKALGQIVTLIQECWIQNFLATRVPYFHQRELQQLVRERARWSYLTEEGYKNQVLSIAELKPQNEIVVAPIKPVVNPNYGVAGISVDAKGAFVAKGPSVANQANSAQFSAFGRPVVPLQILSKATALPKPNAFAIPNPDAFSSVATATASAPPSASMQLGGYAHAFSYDCSHPRICRCHHPHRFSGNRF
jgi:hypothetical protein